MRCSVGDGTLRVRGVVGFRRVAAWLRGRRALAAGEGRGDVGDGGAGDRAGDLLVAVRVAALGLGRDVLLHDEDAV